MCPCFEVKKLLEHHPESYRCSSYHFQHRRPKEIEALLLKGASASQEIEASTHGASRLEPYNRAKKKKLAAPRGIASAVASDGTGGETSNRPKGNSGLPTSKVDMLDLGLAKQYRDMTALNRTGVKPYYVMQSAIAGMGLYVQGTIKRGQMVTEYIGELIGNAISDRRELFYETTGVGGCYMFRIDESLIVDATKKANEARFINHSCAANLQPKVITVEGTKHIVFFAKRAIHDGEELSFDYQLSIDGEAVQCFCGAPGCLGRMA